MFIDIPVSSVSIIPTPPEGEVHRAILDKETGRISIVTHGGESVVTKELGPCFICKTKTNRYEISYGGWFCSDKCIGEMDKDFYAWIKEEEKKSK